VKRITAQVAMIGVWSYGYPHWRWIRENEYLPENIDAALGYWRRDNPRKAYRGAVNQPKGRPSMEESLQPLPCVANNFYATEAEL
jgi:hypothetical protein